MSSNRERVFLAADVYPRWKRRVQGATASVRVFTPYADRLLVALLGNANIAVDGLSVVTDLSPESGALDYRGQLLAIKRLLTSGIDVRTLPRLHAKVLLVDGVLATVGSQNFTSYARRSKETTVAAADDLGDSDFVAVLDSWFASATPVDVDLIERLLSALADDIEAAERARRDLADGFGRLLADWEAELPASRLRDRLAADMARARSKSVADGLRVAADDSGFRAGQEVAYARLDWNETWTFKTLRADRGADLTRWTRSFLGVTLDNIRLEPHAFYPVLLGPDAQMAFVRVARSRISYVWRGVRWGAPLSVGGRQLYVRASFPSQRDDGANFLLSFGWQHGATAGVQVALQFDGTEILPVAEGQVIGQPGSADLLTAAVRAANEDAETWESLLSEVLSPALNPSGFRNHPNAESFFPSGWLRVDLNRVLDQPVLLIQPN